MHYKYSISTHRDTEVIFGRHRETALIDGCLILAILMKCIQKLADRSQCCMDGNNDENKIKCDRLQVDEMTVHGNF